MAAFTNKVLAILLIGATALTLVSAFGYDGLYCSSDLDANVTSRCEDDCIKNHNAESGKCGDVAHGDFTCLCTEPKSTFNKKSQQCLNNVTNPHFEALCRMDCVCNHGALDSKCNHETQACECIGLQKEKSEWIKLCPFQKKEEFLVWELRAYLSTAMELMESIL